MPQDALHLAERGQGVPQIEPEIDPRSVRGRHSVARLLERGERALEVVGRGAIGRAGQRPRARLAEVVRRLRPSLAPHRVLGQGGGVGVGLPGGQRLQRGQDPRVQDALPLLGQAPVRDQVGQRVLEDVGRLGDPTAG